MDLSMTTSMNLSSYIAGDSVIEIGPIEAVGTAPAGKASATPADLSGSGAFVDWYLNPFSMWGTFTDNLGSKIKCIAEDGPDGNKAIKLTSTIVMVGWCGIGYAVPAERTDISRNTCFKFKARCSVAGDVQMGLTDKYNVQYVSHFKVSGKDWDEITVPFSSFVKDPFYTPPGAYPGHPMDFTKTRNLSFMLRMTGDSILELGPVSVTGTGGTFGESAAYRKAQENKKAEDRAKTHVVKISRSGGTPISPFAFGNNYFNWLGSNGMSALRGTEKAVKALGLNVIVGANNLNDANTPQLFDSNQEDRFIEYCRAVGAEPIMIVPVYGNNVDGGRMSAQMAADIVTYINGTKKYGVKYWSIGTEVDIYNIYFSTVSQTKTRDLPVSTVEQYAEIYNSYARAMKEANEKAHSGVDMKFVGPELGARYNEGSDWLSPMLDKCGDYIDVVSIHAYGFEAHDLSKEDILSDVGVFRQLVRDVKDRIAKHGRPGTPLAITEANVCYEAFPGLYTQESRKIGPGTFYAAIWDADRMGAALEENLWTFAFWNLAEYEKGGGNVFGFVLTDPSKTPPGCKLTPEYYAEQMVDMNFSGNIVVVSGVPDDMSVYASYDRQKAATAVLVLNKDSAGRTLKLMVDGLKFRTLRFAPMSINIINVPDDDKAGYRVLEYTKEMADAGLPPKVARR
jgi:hypothetical protein